MRSSGVIKVLYVVRKASQYKTRSAKQKTEELKKNISVQVQSNQLILLRGDYKYNNWLTLKNHTLQKKQKNNKCVLKYKMTQAGKTKLFQWPRSLLTQSPVSKHRLSMNLCTIPLRSVSVAWTNRISPDPARTSGPSSFWGKKFKSMTKINGRRKLRVWDRKQERKKKYGYSWRGVTQFSPNPFCLFFFCFHSHHKAPTSPCPAPAPLMTKKKSSLHMREAAPLQYIIWNNCVCHQKLQIFFSSFHDLSLSPSVNHFCYIPPNLAAHGAAPLHNCLSDCTTQDKGGGGAAGGWSLNFQLCSFWGLTPEGSNSCRRQLSQDMISYLSESRVNFSLCKTNRIKRALYASDAQFCNSRFLKPRAQHQR